MHNHVQDVKLYQVEVFAFSSANRKVYPIVQRRCGNLILNCSLLISALKEDSESATPSAAHRDALDEADASVSLFATPFVSLIFDRRRTLRIIHNRVSRWANLSTMRSLLRKGEIRGDLEDLHRKIDTCISTYQVPTPFNDSDLILS
jgi:hypothetical protein